MQRSVESNLLYHMKGKGSLLEKQSCPLQEAEEEYFEHLSSSRNGQLSKETSGVPTAIQGRIHYNDQSMIPQIIFTSSTAIVCFTQA